MNTVLLFQAHLAVLLISVFCQTSYADKRLEVLKLSKTQKDALIKLVKKVEDCEILISENAELVELRYHCVQKEIDTALPLVSAFLPKLNNDKLQQLHSISECLESNEPERLSVGCVYQRVDAVVAEINKS